jgi:hypothetical protein
MSQTREETIETETTRVAKKMTTESVPSREEAEGPEELNEQSEQPERANDEKISATILSPVSDLSSFVPLSPTTSTLSSPVELPSHNTIKRKPAPVIGPSSQQNDSTNASSALVPVATPIDHQETVVLETVEQDHEHINNQRETRMSQDITEPSSPIQTPPTVPVQGRLNPEKFQVNTSPTMEPYPKPHKPELPAESPLENARRDEETGSRTLVQYPTYQQDQLPTDVLPPPDFHQRGPIPSYPNSAKPPSTRPEIKSESSKEFERRIPPRSASSLPLSAPTLLARPSHDPQDYGKSTVPLGMDAETSHQGLQPGLEVLDSQYPYSNSRSPPPPFSEPASPETRDPEKESSQQHVKEKLYESGLEVANWGPRLVIDPDAYSIMNQSIAGESTSSKRKTSFLGRFMGEFKSSKSTLTYKLPPNMEFCFSSCGSRVLLWTKKDSSNFVSIKYPFKDGNASDLDHIHSMIPKDLEPSSASIRFVTASRESTAIIVYVNEVSIHSTTVEFNLIIIRQKDCTWSEQIANNSSLIWTTTSQSYLISPSPLTVHSWQLDAELLFSFIEFSTAP